ncbi:TIGR04283 family arsenosugar biosynthesis glycosyltransferase [Thermodesulfobacteriota bacterium]
MGHERRPSTCCLWSRPKATSLTPGLSRLEARFSDGDHNHFVLGSRSEKSNMNQCTAHGGDLLILFTRYPVPGRTKKRLIPCLGPAGAAELHRVLTERALTTALALSRLCSVAVETHYAGGNAQGMRRWLGDGCSFTSQEPGTLGERMHSAFCHAFREGRRRVVLVGTDVPGLGVSLLKKAFHALSCEDDCVLGPSLDGGYWLIGLCRPVDVFDGIAWGTGDVLAQTLQHAGKRKLKVRLLPILRDVDTADDLRIWNPRAAVRKPYLSVIVPALNEGKNIASSLHSARDEDAEVILVDGGSSDDTLEKAAPYGPRVIKSRPGRARQQNLGAIDAKGDVLLFLHADTRLPDGFLREVFDALLDPRVHLGAFRFQTDLDSRAMRLVEHFVLIRSKLLNLPYGDQALFFRRPVFWKAGGFPDTPIAEDLFLVRTLGTKGRVRTLSAPVTTSARRWREFGILRTTCVNIVILAACYLGVSTCRLRRLYDTPSKADKQADRIP